MKNNKDYIYEYSDLNLFQTRVKILSGKYNGIILEFGASSLIQSCDINNFKFEYTLYDIPDTINYKLIGDRKFEKYLSKLLISIIKDKRKDKNEKNKLDIAASVEGCISEIKIDNRFYNKQKSSTNTQIIDF